MGLHEGEMEADLKMPDLCCQATMNVIDTLAIAPYFLTLFFVEPPEIGPINEELRYQAIS